MYCGGGHLGFPIGIKNLKFVEDLPMKNDHWKVLYKVCVFYADRKSKMATTSGHRLTLEPMGKCSNAFFTKSCRSRHFEFHIGTKNVKFVEDHPMNIHVQFGFNHICSF
jgi:hypothetical protein